MDRTRMQDKKPVSLRDIIEFAKENGVDLDAPFLASDKDFAEGYPINQGGYGIEVTSYTAKEDGIQRAFEENEDIVHGKCLIYVSSA